MRKRGARPAETLPDPPSGDDGDGAVAADPRPLAEGDGADVSPFLVQVIGLVQKNLDNPAYDIACLCTDMAVSRMNLYRKFQAVTQQTPSEFIRSIRLKHGAELLQSTEQSVSEVAYAVGFTSPQYFIKCFKEEYGETPKKFRQQNGAAQK